MKTALLLLLVGCNAWIRSTPPPEQTRAAATQRDAAVVVEVFCADPFTETHPELWGDNIHRIASGVMVSDWQVLTALHVVVCPGLPKIHVFAPSGEGWTFVPEKEWQDRDVARIQIASADSLRPHLNPPKPRLDPPAHGEVLTTRAMRPQPDAIPGTATGSYSLRSFAYTATTAIGNSGAGVYDEFGELVGIHLGRDENNRAIAARVTREMLP